MVEEVTLMVEAGEVTLEVSRYHIQEHITSYRNHNRSDKIACYKLTVTEVPLGSTDKTI